MRKFCLWWLFAVLAFADNAFVSTQSSFTPVLEVSYDKRKASLGRKLFFDKRLSRSESYSCETCHNLYWDFSGTTSKARSGLINPPSVLNAALNFIFFHDGRARSIRDQVKESIIAREQLNSDEKRIVQAVSRVGEYRILFDEIYDDGIKFNNIVDVLVEFQRAIATVNSPFDRYLAGDKNALTGDEKKGFELFKSIGCVACHNGRNLGGNLMQDVNFSQDILTHDGNIAKKLYRVPSLRNIAKTAPYLSDGSAWMLKDTISHISRIQLGYDISDQDRELLYKFLLSLNGERPRIVDEYSSD